MFINGRINIVKMTVLSNLTYRFNAILINIPRTSFKEPDINAEIYIKTNKNISQIAKALLIKDERNWKCQNYCSLRAIVKMNKYIH